MKKILSLCLVAIMALTLLASCGGFKLTQENIKGTWNASLSLEECINSASNAGEDLSMFDGFNFEDLYLTMELTFDGNGNYHMEVNHDSAVSVFYDLVEQMLDKLLNDDAYLESVAGISASDLADLGMTKQEFIDLVKEQITPESLAEAVETYMPKADDTYTITGPKTFTMVLDGDTETVHLSSPTTFTVSDNNYSFTFIKE